MVARVWDSEDRLPAAESKLDDMEDPTHPPVERTAVPTVPVPVQIGALMRRINTAVRAQETAVVRGLCRDAEREMSRCEGLALSKLETAATAAGAWLREQDRLRGVLFTRLKEAEQQRNRPAARSLVEQVNGLLQRGESPSEAETRILAAARRLTTHLPQSARRPGPRGAYGAV